MTGADLKRIRHARGLSTVQLGRALGYKGNDNTVSVMIRRYESGGREIPPRLILRLIELGWYQMPGRASG